MKSVRRFVFAVVFAGAGMATAQVPAETPAAVAPAPANAPDVVTPETLEPTVAAVTDGGGTLPCRRGADDGRPRIGLVLGGGGARGFAHVAILKELERQRIPVDCIAGTSIGAMVGGLYASGMSAAQIEDSLRAMDWPALFEDRADRAERSFRRKRDDDLALVAGKPGIGNDGIKLAAGVLSGQRIMLLLERQTQPVALRANFDRLPIPFRAVATDLNSGQAVVIGDGNLALAIRASMSIPGVFRPVRRDERWLVDGGLVNQLPVDVVRAMGADIVIAVDVGSPLLDLDEDASPLDIVDQVSGFMTVGSAERQIATLGPRDVLLRPKLGAQVRSDSFDKFDEAMVIGADSFDDARPQLAALALAPAGYAGAQPTRPDADATAPVIDFVRLDNRSRYADSVLLSRINVTPGQPLDAEKLKANLQRIYGMDTFDLVTYDVVEEDGKTGIVVSVVPHSFGPNYLETGLSVYSDFGGDFFLSLRAGVLRAPVNRLGGELRGLLQIGDEPGILLDYYQPIGAGGEYFINGSMSIETPRFSAFDPDTGERIASYRAPNWGGEAAIGREFGNFGAATATIRRREGHAELELGDAVIDELDYDLGEVELAATFDRIDSTYLPRDGTYAVANALISDQSLGADANFIQGGFDAIHARAIGKHSGFLGARWHGSSDDMVPASSKFRIGGLTRFAGYRPNERLADNYAIAYGGYNYELGRFLNRPAVLGGTLELGQTWTNGQPFDDGDPEIHGSLYFGIDSWIGPVQLGYGLREGGEGVFLLEVGRQR